jgi:microcompartment protein CcmK/EutM
VILGEVVGRVWNERQVAGLQGRRLVAVRTATAGEAIVAVDLLEVGAGSLVLIATDEAAQAAAGGDAGRRGRRGGRARLGRRRAGVAAAGRGDGDVTAVRFLDPGCKPDVPVLGGKGSGLAFLVAGGVRIPPAFVVTADGYRRAVGPDLRAAVAERLAAIPEGTSGQALEEHSAAVRALIMDGTEDHPLRAELREACEELQARTGEPELTVAVRSSSIAEDAADKVLRRRARHVPVGRRRRRGRPARAPVLGQPRHGARGGLPRRGARAPPPRRTRDGGGGPADGARARRRASS